MSAPDGSHRVLTVTARPAHIPVAEIPVAAAVRVIAAGLFKRREGGRWRTVARVTIVLTPVAGDKGSALRLGAWPSHVEDLVAKGVPISVWPLGADGGRGTPPPQADPVLFRRAKAPTVPHEAVTGYWHAVMGGQDGLADLGKAFGAGASTLQALVRPAAAGGGGTPNIYGTDRSVAAVEYTLERAREILDRLTGDPPTAATATDDPTLVAEAMRLLALDRPEPSAGTDLTDSDLVARYLDAQDAALDRRAWQALQSSREQADVAAQARRDYLGAGRPGDALAALAGGRGLDCRPAPHAAARTRALGTPASDATGPAKAAIRLSTRIDRGAAPADGGGGASPPGGSPAPDAAATSALRRLYALQAHPSLARLFRMAVDLECAVEELEAALGRITAAPGVTPAPGTEAAVLDHDEPLADGPAPPSRLPEAGPALPRFLFLSVAAIGTASGGALPDIWSTAKYRPAGAAERAVGHFYPCTREEVDAFAAGKGGDLRAMALAEQVDGMVDLGQSAPCPAGREPRFDIVTLDAITSTASDAAGELAAAHADPSASAEDGDARGTLRTGGLGLVDRWRREHAIARFLASQRQNDHRPGWTAGGAVGDAFQGGLLLDASDLTVGYKLDVGVKSRRDPAGARRRWHTLMRRKVAFVPERGWPAGKGLDAAIDELYPDGPARQRADDGMLNVPAALRDAADGEATAAAFAEEIVGTWRGDPLGLAPGRKDQPLDRDDVRVGMVLDLPTRADGANYTPPPLRFGWRYHFGLRATFAGGVAIPLERALGHYERSHGGQLALPRTGGEGRAFRRHERIDAPSAAIPDWCFGTPAHREQDGRLPVAVRGAWSTPQSERMIVRSVQHPANAAILEAARWREGAPGSAAAAGLSRRVLLPPAVALDFAGLHGALDGAALERDVVLHEARVLGNGERALPGEGCDDEWVVQREPVIPGSSEMRRVWRRRSVAWREARVRSRPRGGLEGVDYDAAWGGLPVFRMLRADAGDDHGHRNDGDAAPPDLGELTDAGEIVAHLKPRRIRIGGTDALIVRRAVEDTPSGPAVFRRRRPAGGQARSKPFYPDPGASHMVVAVAVAGGPESAVSVPLYRTVRDGPVPVGYPDALPIVLDVVRDATPGGAPRRLVDVVGGETDGIRAYGEEAMLRRGADARGAIMVRQVVVRLRPGERASIKAWCLPGKTFLERMSEPVESAAALCAACGCASQADLDDLATADTAARAGFLDLTRTGLQVVGPGDGGGAPIGVGGLRLPSQAVIDGVARSIGAFMLSRPIPEVAAVLEIEATHAVDLPQDAPAYLPPAPAPDRIPFLRIPSEGLAALLAREPSTVVPPAPAKDGCAAAPATDLRDSRLWTLEAQAPGAVGFLVDGTVTVHGASTGAFEVHATGPAAAHGRFDDPERGRARDDQARGLWPRPDGEALADPRHLFGFGVAADGRVTLKEETVSLLRVDGFGPGEHEIGLLEAQRAGFERKGAGTWRATRPAAIPDACARYVRLFAVAIARHGGLLRTRADVLPERLSLQEAAKPPMGEADGKPGTTALGSGQWLPATVRPARVAALSLIPSFAWTPLRGQTRGGVPAVSVRRVPMVRVRMRRPWFSAGQGERLGIVVWPPNLFRLDAQDIQQDVIREIAPGSGEISLRDLPDDGSGEVGGGSNGTWEFRDADLGPGGAWVSRWGADPVRNSAPVPGWLLSKDNFHDPRVATAVDWGKPPDAAPPDGAVAEHVFVPVPAGSDAPESRAADPAGGFLSAALVTYEARFDPEQEHWYADVLLDPLAADSPFVRLGLVRFQPHAPRSLMVSEPVVEWAQVLPKRTATAWVTAREDVRLVHVEVKGVAAPRGNGPGDPAASPAQRATVRMALLRRTTRGGEDLGEVVMAEVEAQAALEGADTAWTTPRPFEVPASVLLADGATWSVYVEEFDRLRPGTYPDEPRMGTSTDRAFTETGPRFSARLDLGECLAPYRRLSGDAVATLQRKG